MLHSLKTVFIPGYAAKYAAGLMQGPAEDYAAPVFTLTGNAPAGHPLPRLAYTDDAGYDLTAAHDVVIRPGGREVVKLGVKVKLGAGTAGMVCSRSGLARDRGVIVLNAPGVVDRGYSGELKAVLHNTDRTTVRLGAGTRVAQLVVTPVVTAPAPLTVRKPARGAAGFGSTGGTEQVRPVPVPEGTDGMYTGSGKASAVLEAREAARKADKDKQVNHPAHYNVHPVFTGECHDYTRHMSFDLGNAFKYLWRVFLKDTDAGNVDALKAGWYLNAYIEANGIDRAPSVPGAGLLMIEIDGALGVHDPATTPVKFKAALAYYTAAAYLAYGMTNHALTYLEHGNALYEQHAGTGEVG